MRLLKELDIEDAFRPAHPRQVSLNNRRMSRETVYRVKKIYQMAPFTMIVEPEEGHGGFYSVPPGMPVIGRLERPPIEDAIYRFLLDRRPRVDADSYRVLWDGESDLCGIISKCEMALLRLLQCFGRDVKRFEFNEATFRGYLESSPGGDPETARYLSAYLTKLANAGLIEVVMNTPAMPPQILAANLQKEYANMRKNYELGGTIPKD